jgi:hypothetical protein
MSSISEWDTEMKWAKYRGKKKEKKRKRGTGFDKTDYQLNCQGSRPATK